MASGIIDNLKIDYIQILSHLSVKDLNIYGLGYPSMFLEQMPMYTEEALYYYLDLWISFISFVSSSSFLGEGLIY